VRSASGRSNAELNDIIESLRLQGQLPPSQEGQSSEKSIADLVFGG
jgi:hypothetical protein